MYIANKYEQSCRHDSLLANQNVNRARTLQKGCRFCTPLPVAPVAKNSHRQPSETLYSNTKSNPLPVAPVVNDAISKNGQMAESTTEKAGAWPTKWTSGCPYRG